MTPNATLSILTERPKLPADKEGELSDYRVKRKATVELNWDHERGDWDCEALVMETSFERREVPA